MDEVIIGEDTARSSGRKWLRNTRLILSFLIGTAITLLVFYLMVAHKLPWQFNFVLAPGAIVAILLGAIIHYKDPWYGLAVVGVNCAFYASLVYVGSLLCVRGTKTRY